MTETKKVFTPYLPDSGRRAEMKLTENDWKKVWGKGNFVVTDTLTGRTYLIKHARGSFDIVEEVNPTSDKPTLALVNNAGDIQRDAVYQANRKEREVLFAKREKAWALNASKYGITEKIGDIFPGLGRDENDYKILGWDTSSKTFPAVRRTDDRRTQNVHAPFDIVAVTKGQVSDRWQVNIVDTIKLCECGCGKPAPTQDQAGHEGGSMTDLELTSRHEVGHALVAQSLSEPCLGVSIVADKYSLGRTHTGRRRPVLHEIMILFAGGIAEFESDPSLYGYRAIECDAEDVARLLDADPLRIQTAMHGLIVAQKPPDQHKEILTESYRLAVNVLTKEWTTVCRLADHLCAVRSMNFYDVQKFWKEKART